MSKFHLFAASKSLPGDPFPRCTLQYLLVNAFGELRHLFTNITGFFSIYIDTF